MIIDERQQLERVMDLIQKYGGLDCQYYKIGYLKRRLAIRMRATGLKTYQEYADLLFRDSEEYHRLMSRLTIHVSHFFRDASMYKAFSEMILPELKKRSRVRIWSAGCANGEEPYSLAMLLFDYGKAQGKTLSILATDIDENCLANARCGVYKESALVELPPGFRQRFFQELPEGWTVVPEVRAMVDFRVIDLTGTLPPGLFDLIICRNVMIYFNSLLQSELLRQFYKLLNPEGFLILGKTEVLLNEYREYFKVLELTERLYQRVEPNALGA